MKISGEFKVGLLALVAMVMLYTGFNFLKGTDFFSSEHKYFVVYQEVNGLTPSHPVKINGTIVGRVEQLTLMQNRNNKVLVEIAVDEEFRIPKNTIAMLADDGINGKMIDLKLTNSPSVHTDGDTLRPETKTGLITKFTEAEEKINSILTSVDSTTHHLNNLMQEFEGVGFRTKSAIETYTETARLVNTMILESRGELNGTLRNFNTLSGNLVQTEKSLKPIVTKFDSFADSLNNMQLGTLANKANSSMQQLNQMLEKINKGEGNIGALLKDESLYKNLNEVTADLNKLLIDLRKNPKRYIRLSVF